MAGTPPEQPWSNHEKNYLLAEVIKHANPPAHVLFDVLRNLNIHQPRWEEVPLPPGRSLNSSRYAFEELRRSLQMGAPVAPSTPTPLSGPGTLKRPFPYEANPYQGGGATAGGGREIRPKLPASLVPTGYAQPSQAEPPPKRKRGRPTKAESLKKAESSASASQTGAQGPTSGPGPMSQAPAQRLESAAPTTTEEAKPAAPPTTTMAISTMLTPTARETRSSSHSHSSSPSGKRTRARSTKSEHEDSPVTQSNPARQEDHAPYAHTGVPPDTPARAAVLRHREEPLGVPRSTPETAPPPDPTE